MGKRIFEVGRDGIAIEKPDESEIRKEKEEFLAKIRNHDWFRELLERLGMSEKDWLETCVKTGTRTIRCFKCKKRFIPDRAGRTGIFLSVCDSCFIKWADKLLGRKKGK